MVNWDRVEKNSFSIASICRLYEYFKEIQLRNKIMMNQLKLIKMLKQSRYHADEYVLS